MPQSWNDINDPGVFKPIKSGGASSQATEYATDKLSEKPKDEQEVKLVSAEWEEGPEGFQFNKKCNVKISAEFLKETIRKKVTCQLFVVFDGQEEDLSHTVDADLDDDGCAKAEVTLYYGNAYYNALQENPDATCQYKVKVAHSTAKAELESAHLEMPKGQKKSIVVRLNIKPEAPESQDDTFRLFSDDAEMTYDKTLTVKDDKKPGDNYLDLEFEGIDETLSYSLEINLGAQGSVYHLFQNKSFQNLQQ
jgi:hypothetical protein